MGAVESKINSEIVDIANVFITAHKAKKEKEILEDAKASIRKVWLRNAYLMFAVPRASRQCC
jgi:hypothetical protein